MSWPWGHGVRIQNRATKIPSLPLCARRGECDAGGVRAGNSGRGNENVYQMTAKVSRVAVRKIPGCVLSVVTCGMQTL